MSILARSYCNPADNEDPGNLLWLDLSITRPAEREISEREAETSRENEPRVEIHNSQHERVGDPDVDEVQD